MRRAVTGCARGARRLSETHLLHVLPVRHDAVLDRVLEGEHTTLGLRLVSNVGVLLVHADHDAGVLRASDDGREDGARGVVTGEAGLAHAGAVVDDESLLLALIIIRVIIRVIVVGRAAAKAEDEVESRLLLDVVVRKGAAVLELLAGEDETLLIRGDALLVLDLLLDVLDRVSSARRRA